MEKVGRSSRSGGWRDAFLNRRKGETRSASREASREPREPREPRQRPAVDFDEKAMLEQDQARIDQLLRRETRNASGGTARPPVKKPPAPPKVTPYKFRSDTAPPSPSSTTSERNSPEAAVPDDLSSLMDAISAGYVDYSHMAGKVTVADVSHLKFDAKPGCEGDCCIKGGYVRGAERWVVKVASGWPNNTALGLSNSQGVMLVFSQTSGVLEDGGYLTDLRTALAASLCVRSFAPQGAKVVALVGTGVIASLLVQQLPKILPEVIGIRGTKGSLITEATLLVASRSREAAEKLLAAASGWAERRAVELAEAADLADVLVTCTPSSQPLISRLKPGQLIVALGADAKGKRELGPQVFAGNPVVLADSKTQCLSFGECASAVKDGVLAADSVAELGSYLASGGARASAERSVVVDLTGVAVQDVVIASMVLDAVDASQSSCCIS
ncbi:unnamed protein product [Effrenium voratum]|uniref:Ornithine cyclodeaminase n=1 Tax=Effrenium voratum TaxID=2562239 RepID=A0AA36N2Y0_9DINO|nr:unnamed protein product [Effrenium voratum]